MNVKFCILAQFRPEKYISCKYQILIDCFSVLSFCVLDFWVFVYYLLCISCVSAYMANKRVHIKNKMLILAKDYYIKL